MSENDRRGWFVFGVLLAGVGIFLFILGDSTTFFRDEWSYLDFRDAHDVANLLASHQDQFVAGQLVFYVGLFKGIGLEHYWVFRLLTLPLLLGTSFVIYLIGSRRMGPWAIAPALTILLIGISSETLLWPLGILSFGAVCFLGTSALVALDRRDWKWDLVAFFLLMAALGLSGLTLAFLPAAALGILLLPDRDWRRLWIVAVPGAIFLVWSHYYRVGGLDLVSSIEKTPGFAWDMAVNGVQGLTGLPWALSAIVLLGLAAFILVRLLQVGRESPIAWQAAVVLVAFLLLTAIARSATPEGDPEALRYIFPTVFLLIVMLVAVAPAGKQKRAYSISLTVLVVVLLPHNVGALKDGSDFLKETASVTRAELGAAELSREFIPPDAMIEHLEYPDPAANVFSAIDRYESSPGFDKAEILAAPELSRKNADRVVALAEGMVTVPDGVTSDEKLIGREGLDCRRLGFGSTYATGVLGGSKIWVLAPYGAAAVSVRRYASRFHAIPTPKDSRRYLIATPDSAADPPWRVRIRAAGGPVRICSG